MKRLLIKILFIAPFIALAQQPYINDFSPKTATVDDKITIVGSGLSGNPKVFFNGVEASNVKVISSNLIEATVPSGAKYGSISVINNNLTATSSQKFTLSFGGNTMTNFDDEFLVSSSETDANDIVLCDFDGDKKNDIIISHNVNESGNDNNKREISIYRNNLTNSSKLSGNNFELVEKKSNPDGQPGLFSIAYGDLDNDGKPELVGSANKGTNSRHIYIYQNKSTVGNIDLQLVSSIKLKIPQTSNKTNRIPGNIKIADIDGDGKNDLVIGNVVDLKNDPNNEESKIHIFRNTSTSTGSFSFANPTETDVLTAPNTRIIAVSDLNNDNKPDVIVIPFRKSNEKVYVLENTSGVGKISFKAIEANPDTDQRVNIKVADFNNDGKIDIITTSRQFNNVKVFQNTSTSSAIKFNDPIAISIPNSGAWGMETVDVNGDNKADLVVGGAAARNKKIFLIENKSSESSIKFKQTSSITTTSDNLHIQAGDINSDAKPDIIFTHNIKKGEQGNLGILINRNCIKPEIIATSSNICLNENTVTSTNSAKNATYKWSVVSGNVTFSQPTNQRQTTFKVTSGISATIKVEIKQDDCTTSQTKTFSTQNAAVTPTPSISISDTNGGAVCEGDAITFSTSKTYTSYRWTKPDGTKVTTDKIVISNISAKDAGTYQLEVKENGKCSSKTVTKVLKVDFLPIVSIKNQSKDFFCNDAQNDPILEVPKISGITYQWKKDGQIITSGTKNTFKATSSGTYSVILKNTNGCTKETKPYKVTEVTSPAVAFTIPEEICLNSTVLLTAQSTVDSGFEPVNTFVITDPKGTIIRTKTPDNISFKFVTEGIYKIKLTTSYDAKKVISCANSITKQIKVSPAPKVTFDTPSGTKKCREKTIKVSITNPAQTEISGIKWSIDGTTASSTTNTLDAQIPTGKDEAFVKAVITTKIGCTIQDSIQIQNFTSTSLKVSPENSSLASGDTTINNKKYLLIKIDENNFVKLLGSGGTNYKWEPNSNVSDPNQQNTTFFPNQPLTLVSLQGTDSNKCNEIFTVAVLLDNLRPRKTFSPNNDSFGFNCWEILNISSSKGCKVFIFDSRGKNILVKESPFSDNCVWDGNYNGKEVPEGVYYYILKCDDGNLSKTGSILLAR